MVKVEFHFDFGSPNAYLSHLVIPEIEKRTGAKFEYVPVLLGGVFKMTNNRSPAQSLAGIKNKPEYERLEMTRFIKRHGITRFQSNPFFPVNTLMMMRGAIAARSLDVFERYVDEMYRNMWAEPKKMDDPDVFRAALERSRAANLEDPRVDRDQAGQGPADREHESISRARHLRLADLLRRQRDLLRQGSTARRRGNDRRVRLVGSKT